MEKRKPLIRVLLVRNMIVPNFGLRLVAGENGALADVSDETETETLRWNEDRHLVSRVRYCSRRGGQAPYLYSSS